MATTLPTPIEFHRPDGWTPAPPDEVGAPGAAFVALHAASTDRQAADFTANITITGGVRDDGASLAEIAEESVARLGAGAEVRSVLLAEPGLEYLAARVAGRFGDECQVAGALVGGQPLAAERLDLGVEWWVGRIVGDDDRDRCLASPRVGHSDHRDLGDLGMVAEDVEPAAVERLLPKRYLLANVQ